MADETTVSQEAFDREVRKRESAEKDLAEARTKLEDATGTLSDYLKRDKARVALKGKVADPDMVSDLITPFLKDVDSDKVAETVASEEFAPRLAAFQPAPPPPGGDDGEGSPAGAVEAPNATGFGPSPGSADGAKPLEGKQPIQVGSDEWKTLIRQNDQAALEAAYKEGRVVQPARNF